MLGATSQTHKYAPARTACPSGAAHSAWPNKFCLCRASMPVPVLPPAGQSANPLLQSLSAPLGQFARRLLTWMKWEAVLLETIIAPCPHSCQVVVKKLLHKPEHAGNQAL